MIVFEKVQPIDWLAVKRIYEEGIATGHATFQQASPGWEEWDNSHLQFCRIIAKDNDTIVGWAALTPVSGRCVYAGVAEVSVYVSTVARGKGFGKKILEKLVKESERNNIWTLQASIFPENIASIKIHETCGFRIIGTREKIGKMNGTWRNTVLMERRSNITGIN